MENIVILVAGFLIAVLMGQVIIPKILLISLRKRLFDMPDERKVHKYPVSRLGGITFYPVILFVLSIITVIWIFFGHISDQLFTFDLLAQMLSLIAGLTLLYLVGIGDDLLGVRYRNKLVVQLFSASFFPFVGLYINNLYGLLGIYQLTPIIGIPLTVLLVVFITNSINLIDGIDGLASSICIIALGVFGLIFVFDGLWIYSLLAFTAVGVLIPFFVYNVFGEAERGRKIFMGDTGSLTLGYILSFLVLRYCMYMGLYERPGYSGSLMIAFAILLVPCMDVIRVVIGRVRRGESPFLPDKTHIHHKFIAMGFSTRRSLVLIQIMSLCFIIAAALMVYIFRINTNIIFVTLIALWTLLNILISIIILKKNK